MKQAILFVIASVRFISFVAPSADSAKHWVGTWSTAPYLVESANMPPSPGLSNNTLRQVVRVSIGGDTVRLKLTNIHNATAVAMKAVNIAVSKGAGSIDASTLKALKFGGNASATMDPGASITSDPVAFDLAPSMRVTITIYYGQTSPNMTGHVGSRTNSYLLAGNKAASVDFSGAVSTPHWYSINAIDVWASQSAGAVAIIGNSITDGYGLTPDLQNRWTDVFSEALLANPATPEVAVLNMGIGATKVLGTAHTAGVLRFQRDILEQQGLRWAIIYHGVNDIGGGAAAGSLIEGLGRMAAAARARKVKVYGATILPFNGHAYYTPGNEACRKEVNHWIRTGGAFDAVIDFDKTMRDPGDTTRMRAALKNDWLHPNTEGYKVMGESIDLKRFASPPTGNFHNGNGAASSRNSARKTSIPIRDGALLIDAEGHRADGRILPSALRQGTASNAVRNTPGWFSKYP